MQKNQALIAQKAELVQLEGQLDLQKLQAEVEAKKELMAQEFQYNMQLKGMETQNNKSRESQREDRKDDRSKMEASQQSELIELDQNLNTQDIKIFGLYDPEDNGLDINMWANSDGDQLKNIFNKLINLDLSSDAREIMNISLLTNAHLPKKNISTEEFLKLKSDWLIKN